MSSYDFKETETSMLAFWQDKEIHKKANEQNKGNKRYYFLDGPPYTSGRVHIGTAWNKSLKDMNLRYRRMQGLDAWDRAGYDMHGLPTENATQKKLGLKDKTEIEAFGVQKFIEECKTLCVENMKVMNNDFMKFGVWMDFENAYQSITDEFIDGEWWLIKKAHEEKRLYQGYRSIAWDWHDETACAKHELEYKQVTDKSIYVKLQCTKKPDEYLIVWTTTPWTIPMNLGVMVHPEIDYVKCKVTHEGNDEIWIVAKDLAAPFIQGIANVHYEELEVFKGKDLEGVGYNHPLPSLNNHYDKLKEKSENVHTVVMSEEFVTTQAGTGLVHMAPGCGPEDYEIGHRNGIPAWNLLLPNGVFPEEMGELAGMHAKHDTDKFIELIENNNALVAQKEYVHDYPFAQRSKQPVVFRATKQWFLKVEDMKDEMIQENNNISWRPTAAYNAFDSWLKNLRDNSISKQRFWGTPLPVWVNEQDNEDIIVVGSKKELEDLSGKNVEDMHIPLIDNVTIEKDGKTYKRVEDVLDVWVDAGTASWNCLNFPGSTKDMDDLYPADFILEGKDQIRGWFNLLHIASMVTMKKPAFKNCYMHGFINDAKGRKMSKSLGNYILPEEVIEKYGADTLRFYMIGGANPGMDLNYNFEDMQLKHRNLIVLWNVHNFLLEMLKNKQGSLTIESVQNDLGIEEKYILSKLNSTIQEVTQCFEAYKLNEVPLRVEELFLDLSRTYIQMVRDKASIGSETDKNVVAATLYNCILTILKLLAPVTPFIAEKMYQNLKAVSDLSEESLHLTAWPQADESFINTDLESAVDTAGTIIQATLNAREKARSSVRWPHAEIIVETTDDNVNKAIELLSEMIKSQTNVKDIKTTHKLEGVTYEVELLKNQLGKDFGEKMPLVLAKLQEVSSEELAGALLEDKKLDVCHEQETFTIEPRHVAIVKNAPEPYIYSEAKNITIYLNKELNPELLAEGYTREIARRVQNARKKAGLAKQDTIELNIDCDDELKGMLEQNKDHLVEKVHATSLSFGQPKEKYSSDEKVKDKKFTLSF